MALKNIFPFLLLLLVFYSCHSGKQEGRQVSVSILPQKYLIERIAGDSVQVNVLIPPGMSPASCDLSTAGLKKLYDSDLCFTIGYLPFELTHLYPVLEKQNQLRVVNHSAGLELLDGSCGHHHATSPGEQASGIDPHIWLSPANARIMADTLVEVLSDTYPELESYFRANHQALITDIDRLDQRAREAFSDRKQLSFLIYHPALTYFARDYGLEQISIEDEGKEPNPVHLRNLIDTARAKDIRIVFIQSQFDAGNAEAIAREIGAQVIPIDPLSENWLDEMNRLIEIFNTTSSHE